MGLFALDNDDKLQYNNIVMHWVQYPFHDDVVVKSTLSSLSSPSAKEPLGFFYIETRTAPLPDGVTENLI